MATLNEVIALLEEASALNAAAEQSGEETIVRKVALEQAKRALRVTMSYLNSFESIRAGGLVRAFAPLHSAIHNVSAGHVRRLSLSKTRPLIPVTGRWTKCATMCGLIWRSPLRCCSLRSAV
jgi:hypothetical protein